MDEDMYACVYKMDRTKNMMKCTIANGRTYSRMMLFRIAPIHMDPQIKSHENALPLGRRGLSPSLILGPDSFVTLWWGSRSKIVRATIVLLRA